VDGVPLNPSLGDFLVLKNGDTLRGEDLKIRYPKEFNAMFIYKSRELSPTEYSSYQTAWGYSIKSPDNFSSCSNCNTIDNFYHLIRNGRLKVYFTMREVESFSGVSKTGRNTYSTKHFFDFYVQKPGNFIVPFKEIDIIKDWISDNKASLDLLNSYYVTLKNPKKKKEYYKEVLEVIDIYNSEKK